MDYILLVVQLLSFPVLASGNVLPRFEHDEYVVEDLKEKSPIGTSVLNVTAVDTNGDNVTYFLEDESKFSINNKTGEIFVNAILSKKEYKNAITFEVYAYDNVDGPDLKTSAVIHVLLVDINDHVPRFIKEPFHADVSENANIGDIVLKVEAVDEDTSAAFALISYNIEAGNEEGKFAIATYTGHISVVDTLSFDKTRNYILNVSAVDKGGNTNYTTVSITVLDYDNLPAVFDERTYFASVREDAAKGVSIIQVSARDGDSLNATVTYLLDPASDNENKFSVNNITGVITVNGQLDREKESSYLLRIGAKSTHHNPVYTTVNVQVLDVNDNAPVFEKSLYEAFVPENSPVDLTVLQVTATDQDVGENSTLQYILSGADGKFDVRSSGHIVVKANIDREEKSQYKFVVTAQETATADRYESNATVVINITDVNDHNPKCSQDVYKATVDENRPNGTFVAQIVGVDTDVGPNAELRYSLESELDGHSHFFTIDAISGNITTLKPLDRETDNMFTLAVTLRDQAEVEQKRSGSCFIQITIGDQNDNIPKFISLLNVSSVAEDAPPGTTVIEIKAQDADVSSNAEVKYYIVSGNINDTFHLNVSSGILTTKKTLDRESIGQYNLLVNATDTGGMSQTDIVIITISDRNDNPPKFHQPNGYFFTVDENSAALLVGIVQASDADSGLNANLVYSLSPSLNSDKFTIEPATGTLKTAVSLDRETTDSYTVTVIAQDTGSPSLSTNVTVYINISDVNDNIPDFAQEHYVVILEENEKSRVFLNLSASDKDLGINSKLRYSILSGNSDGYFSIDGGTGELSTKKTLDFEKNQIFTLLIQVHDLDGNNSYGEPFHDNCVVYVTVKDINDHAPVFTQPSYSIRLNENITVGSEVILVRATDEDSGDNKIVEYSFVRGNELGKFFIDMNSGRITVMNKIDRDPPYNQTTFNITIMAKDNGNPSLNSTVQLFITIDDVNDNSPVFSKDQYVVDFPENSLVATTLIQLHCVDIDQGRNGQFHFEIKSGINKTAPEFHIDNATGLITSLVLIDYDSDIHEYRLVINAIDGGDPQLVGSTTVVIHITNANDNSPQFPQPSYSFNLKEGSYVGLHHTVGKVTATDLDNDGSHPYGIITYSLQNESSVFTMDNVTGTIFTNVFVDREQEAEFVLKVIAKDGDTLSPRYNTTLVYISVLDENDNAPKFEKERETIDIDEGLPKGYSVGNITAHDLDEGLNGEVSYSILNGDIDSSFVLDDLTGELKTNRVLDRETDDRYDLVIQAQDKGTPSMKSLAFVTVIVDDVNDNAPVITTTSYSSNVKENLPAGQLICKVSATDADDGVNKDITYSLNFPEFAVNSSGFVYTTESLDREEVAEYDIKVVATDGGTPAKSSFVVVHVGVEDMNDNPPVFDKQLYAILISENMTTGSDVIQVTATDQDDGVNAELTYSLSGGNGHFKINRTSGLISMERPVDHEQNPGGFIVFVEASDRGIPSEKTAIVQVNIGISDVNDNSPVFGKYGYEASLSEESALGTVVVQVVAKDRDLGLLGEVIYAISGGNAGDVFSVNNSGFVLVSGKLDRETQEFYELQVQATDKAGIPKSTTTQVNIHILDFNDNHPVIINAPVELEVNETTAVGTALFTIITEDQDIEKTNGKLIFHGLSEDGMLEVDSNTGVVSLSQLFDYSQKQSHILSVYATDHGSPPLTSEAVNISITVIKKDSNTPVFGQPSYIFNISEDTTLDNPVGQVLATQRNPSKDSRIVYEITLGNSEGLFHINSQGALTLLKSLDHESHFSYTIVVTATNSEESSEVGRTVVTFLITDINDSPPIFQYENYRSEVNEDTSLDTSVIIVQAFDPDYDVSADLQYSISSGNSEGKFKIATIKNSENEQVGLISVAGELDRETTETYEMKISVSDGTFDNNCTVKIKVNDINDNDPIFNPSSYESSIPENTEAGFTVLRVTAYDDDIDENAEVSYSITGAQDEFTIEKTTGEIKTTNQSLDRETKYSYAFQVVAVDIDGRKGTANVLITVSDVNDNAPSFPQPSYTTEVTEGPQSKGKVVFTVQATDKDLGANKEIIYSIKDGNIGGTFEINNSTGAIIASTEVDRELEGLGTSSEGRKMFSLTIDATDKGNPPLTTSTVVNIQVTDINDNPPTFPASGYFFMISKDAKSDMDIITVTAIDKDEGENGEVIYEIMEGNTGGDFVIDATTGVLKMAKNLERPLGFQYNLTIKGKDQGSPSLSSTTVVSMTVGPVNLHSPIFNPENYTVHVYENNLPYTRVLNVTATDEDDGQNGMISYSIVNGDNESLFNLITETNHGELNLNGRLDRETQDTYTLEIVSKDGGIPTAREATGFITVTVLDLNDNAPEFTEKNYTGSLPENCGPDVLVQMVRSISASDKDLGINSDIVYTIDGPGSEHFTIDRATAVLKTTTSPSLTLDYETNPTYTFNVIAGDQAGYGLQSTVPITIHLIDENDNTPVFVPSVLRVSIPESTAVNDVIANVTAVDPDPGMNGRVRYSIISGSKGAFSIGEDDGQLRVLHELDREKNDEYRINISGIDGNLYPRQGFGVVVITVLDVNDNPPIFEKPEYTTTVPEDVPINEIITTVHAVDPDKDSVVTYSLEHPVFRVDAVSGDVRTKTTLDRETVGSYSLSVRADDEGGLGTSVAVNIVVGDVNDNAPYYPKNNHYRSDVIESVPIGSDIVLVVAKDDDDGKNAELQYSLAQNVDNLFEINPQSGLLRLKNTLNKAQLISKGLINNTGLMQLKVQARDSGTPALSSYQTIILRIITETDTVPVFNQHFYHFNVTEEDKIGTIVGTVSAVTKSSSEVLTYSFTIVQNHFTLNEDNGEITTKAELNYEEQSYYVFTVRVSDGLSNSGYTSVAVSVVDINNHRPLFQFKSPYKMSVMENARPGTGIGSLRATDEDWGENARITYSFVQANVGPGSSMISVDNSCIMPLGLEAGTIKAVSVTASSTLSDLNKDFSATQGRLNNKPTTGFGVQFQGAWCAATNDGNQFLQVDLGRLKKVTKVATQGRPGASSYVTQYTLSHSLDGSTWVSHDQHFTGNRDPEEIVVQKILPAFQSRYVRLNPVAWKEIICLRVEFYGCNSDGGDDVSIPFIIDETTGMVNVSDSLDRESQDNYIIIVEASDHGNPALHSNTTLEISILDSNDNPPVFDKSSYDVIIPENTFPGDLVTMVAATDKDTNTNGEIVYTIESGDQGKFLIDASTGAIQPSSRLDYENPEDRFFILNISARDLGIPVLTSYVAVFVNVTDFNDNYPVFNASSLISQVQENLNAGAFVARIQAMDQDAQKNSLIQYSLIEASDTFSIDSHSGVVTTSKVLDREYVGNYVINVRATDTGESPLATDAKLLVTIIDMNDNPPVFTEKIYTRRILENSPRDTIVLTIKAEDKDIGLNGHILYSISRGNEKGLFKLDSTTGIISVVKSLDHEVNSTTRFTVIGRDQAAPFYSDETEVVVIVIDVNDNAPVIEPKEMVVSIREDASVGTFVVDVNATDKDSSSNAQLEYSIVHGSSGHFQIDLKSGVVRTFTQLDYEKDVHYTVLVLVRDTGATGYMDFGSIDITVIDVNDNAPTFLMPTGPFEVKENQVTGTEVGIMKASDLDSGSNTEITFAIIGGDSESCFTIGESSGVISTTKSLDRESTSVYDLTITATNSRSSPPLSTNVTVTIHVEDMNDNPPVFNNNSYQGYISENTTAGTNVLRVFAADADKGDAGTLSYSIINGSHSNLFHIDNQTGLITLGQSIVHMEYRNFTLIVKAEDLGSPSLSTSVPVMVTVEDMNDNRPLFDKRVYSASITESAAIGDRVVQMIATDEDTQTSGAITYQIVEGNELGHFRIEADTGWVYVNQSLDRETVDQYELGVRATNLVGNRRRRKRNAPFSDTVKVQINIVDINDNLPIFSPLSYVGGVMPGADVGTLIVQVTATDADTGLNSQLAFNILSGNEGHHFDLRNGSGSITSTAVAVGKPGTLYTLKVLAKDNMGKGSSSVQQADVEIYVLFKSQQALVLSLVHPSMIKNNTDEFIRMLNNITNSQVYIDKIYTVYRKDENGILQPNSDVLFHAVRNLTILSSDEIIRTVDLYRNLLDTFYVKWNIEKVRKQTVEDDDDEDELLGWEIALIVLGVLFCLLFLFCCCWCCFGRWKRQHDEEMAQSPRKTIFTNSPVTRQREESTEDDSQYFYSSSQTGPFSLSQNITNPIYCAELDSDGYEEKEMELSLSDEEPDEQSGKRVSKKEKSFKKSFRK